MSLAIYHIKDVEQQKMPDGRIKLGIFGLGFGGELVEKSASGTHEQSRVFKGAWIHIHMELYEKKRWRVDPSKEIPIGRLCKK